jgi:hypothetical protein
MIAKTMAAILLAAIVVASGAVGSFYFAGAQEQAAVEQAEITVDSEAEAGSEIEVGGSNFAANSNVSIYFMSAAQAEMTNGTTFVLQEASANESTTAEAEPQGGNILEDAMNALGGLLGMGDEGGNETTTTTTTSAGEGSLLVVLSELANGTMSLECADESIAESDLNSTNLVSLAAPTGTYSDCSITVAGDNGTDTGEIGNLTVNPDPDESYESSQVANTTADEEGSFSQPITVPDVEGGEYAVLAASEEGTAAVSPVSVTGAPEVEAPTTNATGAANETAPLPEDNATGANQTIPEDNATITENQTIPEDNATITENQTIPEDNVTGGNQTMPESNATEANQTLPESNATAFQNETLPEGNVTITENQTMPEENVTATQNETETTQNQTEENQTAATEPTVEVEEAEAAPGEPLAISGEGFQPNTPVQVLINNIQITNIVTNIEGSFNSVIIVPTTVNAGDVNIVLRSEQINISEIVNIVEPDVQNRGPATIRFTSVSATDDAQALEDAPVTVFDTSTGQLVESGETPMEVELEAGTYSVFYSDFENFDFESAQPGRWTDTDDGGSGLLTVKSGRNATVTAMYSEEEAPPPPPRETVNSITLRAVDTEGEPLEGMFASIYDADSGEKVEQGFTELTIEDLDPGAYPVFFANFEDLEFMSASPGDWVQTPFGGAGLVTIPDDGEDHNVVVTAVYDRVTEPVQEPEFNIEAPLDIGGDIFTITSNETRPEGPFVMSGSFALSVDNEDPAEATLSAYIMSARDSTNENVQLDSQRSRDHDTFQIVSFEPQVARPVGLNSYLVSGTADLLLNGDLYSNDERIEVIVRGGDVLTPTNVEIEFQGDQRYSAANRLETLYGTVTSGFQ